MEITSQVFNQKSANQDLFSKEDGPGDRGVEKIVSICERVCSSLEISN
jgi:hypothetical protein